MVSDYINGTLIASLPLALSYSASGVSNFITLANSRSGQYTCTGGGMGLSAPGPLQCDIDMFRVYSRQLSTSDIAMLSQI